MKGLEQMTINETLETATWADVALYGGLIAIGIVVGILLLAKIFWYLDRRSRDASTPIYNKRNRNRKRTED